MKEIPFSELEEKLDDRYGDGHLRLEMDYINGFELMRIEYPKEGK